MSTRSVTRGGKFSNSHQTIIESAKPILLDLKKDESISKIVVGKIKNVRSRHAKIINKVCDTSVELTIKSFGELQAFYIIGKDPEYIARKINRYFRENNLK